MVIISRRRDHSYVFFPREILFVLQELSGKFELFQQPADYGGRLDRISRQLRDIQHNMYLTELVSHEPDSIHGQLHHTRCIYNVSNPYTLMFIYGR